MIDVDGIRFASTLSETAAGRTMTFEAPLPGTALRLVKTFEIARDGYQVVLTVRIDGPAASEFMSGRSLALELAPGHGLHPLSAAGFSSALERVGPVVVGAGGVRTPGDAHASTLGAGEWSGWRNRFWTILARAEGPATVELGPREVIALVAAPDPARLSWRYVLYAGPVERSSLAREDPELGRLLFSGLWWWLRALSFALLYLLGALIAVVGHPGLAIIALAATVKLLLLPLTTVAHRLQEQVNTTQARLQPRIDAIKAEHRGEDQARRLVALYREERVHPFYTVKSLVGVLIQLPVFIAVFDMLAEDFDLLRVPFLWIHDLSRPDELLALPGCLPFFGCYLNLLPFLMSGISLIAALRFHSGVLTPALAERQRRNLAGMAILFFLLFFTFPAGMVLYWTSTNGLQLATREVGRLRARRGASAPASG
ncbi:MAG TPA: membrane protein insertase YidC [Methylomirabilota bacterium]|nr:membrane protein insertase YidC [Methylomirabilota bacterium]